uniref:Predicted protein n=1 Tax=Hordeum vulgare subsp. vulgare TaxID=112509 RepID=F2D9M5_HORVV|nr:predicted protein [Hordeum vulgare subsp. vulgare]
MVDPISTSAMSSLSSMPVTPSPVSFSLIGSLISLVLCCSHGIGAAMALCAHAGARGKPSRTSLPPHAKASYLIGAPQRRHCSPEHTVNHPDAIGNGTVTLESSPHARLRPRPCGLLSPRCSPERWRPIVSPP